MSSMISSLVKTINLKSIILAVDWRSIAYPYKIASGRSHFYLWFCVIDICGNRKRKSTAFQKYISTGV